MTKISAIITAGGKSTRYGKNKLLESICNMPLICKTIENFVGQVDEIVVPCDDEVKNVIKKHFSNIIFARCGFCRQKSVLNGLIACNSPDFVLIHDGARPYISKEVIRRTIKEVMAKKAVVAGVLAIDTIKVCDNGGKIIKTPDRSTLYCAQTPQAFEYNLILDAHKKFQDELEKFTDDSTIAQMAGHSVYMIEGDYKNKKITTQDDLA